MDMTLSRRSFVSLGAGFAAAELGGAVRPSSAGAVREPARDVPVAGEYDVIVAGAGPAGFAVAMTAARRGRRTLLLEKRSAPGGVWTSGLVTCVMDGGQSTLSPELTKRLDDLSARVPRQSRMRPDNYLFEPEYMRHVLETMLAEARVDYIGDSPVCAACRDATGRRLEAVVVESESGRLAYRAESFVDATGDGALGAVAGCGFDVGGYGGTAQDQPASLVALVSVDDSRRIARFIVNDPSAFGADGRQVNDGKKALRAELARLGIVPTYSRPTLFRLRGNLLELMSNHVYGLEIGNARETSRALRLARAEILSTVDALARRGGPDWTGARVLACADRPWNRCARRLHGLYTVTAADVAAGRRFDDAAARANCSPDVHSVSLERSLADGANTSGGAAYKPFDVPLRSCRSRDIDNLYMAGRCISGDFIAHSCYRMSGTALAIGESVGKIV